MIQAVWNDTVIAEAEHTLYIEGNHYFPPDSVRREFLAPSTLRTVCFWKGMAAYYDLDIDGGTYRNAAWYYPRPFIWARWLKNHVAFSHAVEIRSDP